MKKILMMAAVAVVGFTTTTSAAILVFNRSLPNQAALGYDTIVDNWDYLIMPGLYSESKTSQLGFGFTNDGGLTAQNTFFGGAHFTVGLPLFVVVGTRNANTVANNEGSTEVDAAGVSTTLASTLTTTLDSSLRAAIGTAFGNLGIQLFADLNSTGASRSYTAISTAATTTLKTGTIENRASATYDRYGVNFGMKSGGMVINVGVAIRASRGSTGSWTSADGTLTSTQTNGTNATPGAFPALAGAGSLQAGADTGNSTLNSRTGLVISSFGWTPMPLIGQKDVLGWVLSYTASTMLGHGDFSFTHKNTTANTDVKGTLKATASGLGDLVINPYYTMPLALAGDAGTLFINLDLNATISSGTVETSPELSGTNSGTAFTAAQIADGFNSFGAVCAAPNASSTTNAANSLYCDKVVQSRSTMDLSFGIPVIANILLSKSVTWIIGAFPKITYKTAETKVTSTDLSTTKTYTSVEAVDKAGNGRLETTVTISTGLKFMPADNFHINLLANGTNSNTSVTNFQFSAAADYLFK